MKRTVATLVLALAAIDAFAVIATLVRSTIGRSITGQAVMICTYRYGANEFDRTIPAGNACPVTINVQ